MLRKKSISYLVLVLAIVLVAFTNTGAAYSFIANDSTHYDYADGYYSIFAFSYVSANPSNGLMTLRGSNPWATFHVCRLWMAFHFIPPVSGRVHCHAILSLYYKLIAGVSANGFSSLTVSLVLMDSYGNPLESDEIWSDEAYCLTSGYYYVKSGTPTISDSVYWTYNLQSGTVYYAAVDIYVETFHGGYAFGYDGGINYPTTLLSDVNKIYVYT